MKKALEEDPEGAALQQLMDAMGQMRQRRIPRPSAPPLPEEVPGTPLPTVDERPRMDIGGDMEMPAGMDPRLAEIIRKKKAGAA